MMDWDAIREDFYVGEAHPADRFVALPCGCILILPRCDVAYAAGYQGPMHSECRHECAVNDRCYDYIDVMCTMVYHHDLGDDGRGHRWN